MKPTVIITGASGNLGKAVVRTLHDLGYSVLALTGSPPRPGEWEGLEVDAMAMDLLDAGKVQTFVQQLGEEARTVVAAVLLVGGFMAGDLSSTDVTGLEKMFRLNFLTTFNVVKPLFDYFSKKGQGGQFILIGSRAPLKPSEGKNMMAYALSKSLIFSLSELINESGKAHSITSTVVVPSTIDTPANRSAMPDSDPGQWVKPEAIADLIGFSLSETGSQMRESVLKIYNKS